MTIIPPPETSPRMSPLGGGYRIRPSSCTSLLVAIDGCCVVLGLRAPGSRVARITDCEGAADWREEDAPECLSTGPWGRGGADPGSGGGSRHPIPVLLMGKCYSILFPPVLFPLSVGGGVLVCPTGD